MTEVLYAPDRERVVTTNVWAFLHWLRVAHGVDLADWTALQRWSVENRPGFSAAMVAFECSSSWHDARSIAELSLHADLRPDDRLLVLGPSWPWIAAENEGTAMVFTATRDPLDAAAEERATVLVSPAQALAAAAFQRPGRRPDLSPLRTIIATGGPLSPAARRRVYAWVKADVMLLARTGDTFWGNPLEPVLAQPPATPAFLTAGRDRALLRRT